MDQKYLGNKLCLDLKPEALLLVPLYDIGWRRLTQISTVCWLFGMSNLWWLKECSTIWAGYIQLLHNSLEHLLWWSWISFPACGLLSMWQHLFHYQVFIHFTGIRISSFPIPQAWSEEPVCQCSWSVLEMVTCHANAYVEISAARLHASYVLCSNTVQHWPTLTAEHPAHLDSVGYGVCTYVPDLTSSNNLQVLKPVLRQEVIKSFSWGF